MMTDVNRNLSYKKRQGNDYLPYVYGDQFSEDHYDMFRCNVGIYKF